MSNLRSSVLRTVSWMQSKGIPLPDDLLKDIAALKSMEQMMTAITNDVHALYSRAMSRRDFVRDMSTVITNQLTEAWNTGADELMVLAEDMTPDDLVYLQEIVDNEISYLSGLADDVQQAQSDREGWEQFSTRLDIWGNRYNDVVNRARQYFGQQERMVWNLGSTEVHCDSCAALNGIVAFGWEWEQSGVHPQQPPNGAISCGGWQCDCSITPTSNRRTAGALGRIMDIAVSGNV